MAPNASVARVVWHPQTNQITCSTSAGAVRVLYDPAISDKGAMLSAGRSHGSRMDMSMFIPKHAVSRELVVCRSHVLSTRNYRVLFQTETEAQSPLNGDKSQTLTRDGMSTSEVSYTPVVPTAINSSARVEEGRNISITRAKCFHRVPG